MVATTCAGAHSTPRAAAQHTWEKQSGCCRSTCSPLVVSGESARAFASAIFQHAVDMGYHFRRADARVLSKDSGTISCGIRKAIYIKALIPSLNQNLGWHTLPPIFDDVIHNIGIRRPPPPMPHQPHEPGFDHTIRQPGRPCNNPVSQPHCKQPLIHDNCESKTVPSSKWTRLILSYSQPSITNFFQRSRDENGGGGQAS